MIVVTAKKMDELLKAPTKDGMYVSGDWDGSQYTAVGLIARAGNIKVIKGKSLMAIVEEAKKLWYYAN